MKKKPLMAILVLLGGVVVLVGCLIVWWLLKVGIGQIDTESFRSLTAVSTATTATAEVSTATTKPFFDTCHEAVPTLSIIDNRYVLSTRNTTDCTDTGPSYVLYGKSQDHRLCGGSSGFGKMYYDCTNPLLKHLLNTVLDSSKEHDIQPLEF